MAAAEPTEPWWPHQSRGAGTDSMETLRAAGRAPGDQDAQRCDGGRRGQIPTSPSPANFPLCCLLGISKRAWRTWYLGRVVLSSHGQELPYETPLSTGSGSGRKGQVKSQSEEKWGKDTGIMLLLLLITSIYCAPTMCSAALNAWHAFPPGIPGMAYIVHVTDQKMRLREDR